MRRSIPRRIRATALLVLLAVALLLVGRFLNTKGLSWASEFGSIGSFFLAAFALLLPLFGRWLRHVPATSPLAVAQAGDDLAAALATQWTEEEQLRRINDPRPLPVRWEVTPTAASAMLGTPHKVIGDNVKGAPSSAFAGEFGEILPVFNGIPERRLVILGPVGAGKSVLAMKLARELLAVRQSGMPIPLILSAATWNTGGSLAEWITDQLANNHPGLALKVKDATGKITSLAQALATSSILPIIDGLDELPPAMRARAIIEINTRGSDLPVVVTSRPQEYVAAVADSGRAIAEAMVVELRPLSVAQVEAYLREATAALPRGRWIDVFRRLDAEPAGPLTAVLTTPLMLWLARTVYDSGETTPAYLADRERFNDQAAIENYLLDAFIPAIYAKTKSRLQFRCTPKQAERWLAFLAAYLDRTGSPDLAWWRIAAVVRGWRPIGVAIRAVLSLSVAWLLGIGVFWRVGAWKHGAYIQGHSLRGLLLGGPLGRLARPAADVILNHLQPFWSGVGRNLRIWVSLGSLPSLDLRIAAFAVAIGIFTLHPAFRTPRTMTLRILPVTFAFVRSIFYTLGLGIFAILLLTPASGSSLAANQFIAMPSSRSLLVLVFLLCFAMSLLRWPFRKLADVSGSISPRRVFVLDLRSSVISRTLGGIALTVALWLCSGTIIALAFAIWRCFAILIHVILGGTRSASDLLIEARIWTACGRRVPLRIMRFLSDAHHRGALRQLGSVYEFRHVRLQQRLSSRHPRWSNRWPVLAVFSTSVARYQPNWTVLDTDWEMMRIGAFTRQYRGARFEHASLREREIAVDSEPE